VGRGPQVPGEREDPGRRRGWGRVASSSRRARRRTLSISAARAVARRIDARVAIAPDQAEERVDLAHPGPRQLARQGAGELPDGLAVPLGPARQTLDVPQGVMTVFSTGSPGGRSAGRRAAGEGWTFTHTAPS
jgi:hypothetical protein